MSLFNLFKVGAKNAATGAEAGLITMLEKLNLSDVVDEHQLSQLEDALTKVSQLLVKAKNVFEKESAEYAAIQKAYDSKISDVEKLQTQVTTESNRISVDTKEKFEKHILRLLEELEGMKPDLDREKEEMVEAKDHFDTLKELVESRAKQLASAKEALQKARREAERLDVQAENIKQREEQQKVIMGIRKQTDSMDTVLNAIGGANQKKKDEIEAAKARLDAMKVVADVSKGTSDIDPEIAAALGNPAPSSKSVADRLAALK